MITAQHYAQALYNATADTDSGARDARVSAFLELIQKRGHEKLLPCIIAHFERLTETARMRGSAVLSVAHLDHAERMEARATRHYTPSAKRLEIVEDDRIVGGFVLKDGDVIVDGSYKRMLINLYRTLVT